MARPKKAESDEIASTELKESPKFVVTRVYDPTSRTERALDAYSQDELDKFLASGWVTKPEQD